MGAALARVSSWWWPSPQEAATPASSSVPDDLVTASLCEIGLGDHAIGLAVTLDTPAAFDSSQQLWDTLLSPESLRLPHSLSLDARMMDLSTLGLALLTDRTAIERHVPTGQGLDAVTAAGVADMLLSKTSQRSSRESIVLVLQQTDASCITVRVSSEQDARNLAFVCAQVVLHHEEKNQDDAATRKLELAVLSGYYLPPCCTLTPDQTATIIAFWRAHPPVSEREREREARHQLLMALRREILE
jgi:hypothetical protein